MSTLALHPLFGGESAEEERGATQQEVQDPRCGDALAVLLEKFHRAAMASSPSAPLPEPVSRIENIARIYGSRLGLMERWPRRW
ncbi:MAG: hypothetical protein WCV62_02775 [Candidatus Peribacteraceae bacterium]